jgi:hypothetical protein
MNRNTSDAVFNAVFLSALIALTVVILPRSTEAEQTQIRPRILIIFDTSGSMAYDIDSTGSVDTWGDGSWDQWGTRFCCPGRGNSRMYAAKEAMSQMIFATGDIEFALMKFAQRYSTSVSTQSAYYRYNQTDTGYDSLRYSFNNCNDFTSYPSANDYRWLCTEFSDSGQDNRAAILMWMDHHEYKSDGTGQADSAPQGVTPRSGDGKEQELRADGSTPLANAMLYAEGYLKSVYAEDYADDREAAQCRPYSVVLLTDGQETCSGNPSTAATSLHTLELAGGPSKTVDIFVIGLATDTTTLDQIASNGGTGSASPAGSEEELSEVLYEIISESLLIEMCNYDDDDCDGQTDEDFRNQNGVTFCDPAGLIAEAVAAGVSPTSEQFVCRKPVEAFCDGEDDNCDGQTDEGDWTVHVAGREDDLYSTDCGGCDLGPSLCPTGNSEEGICSQGTYYCAAGCADPGMDDCWQCAGDVKPVSEICDGFDNDCDGLTDESESEDLAGGNGTSWVAEIGQTCSDYTGDEAHCIGEKRCELGAIICYYDVVPVQDETVCDGTDNDCDGLTDEDIYRVCGGCDPANPVYQAPPYNCTSESHRERGECLAGAQKCNYLLAGHWDACIGGKNPATESCNGLDDNCNGSTDEGMGGGSCGPPCNDGTWICNGTLGMSCQGASTPTAEVCNGDDDNCNGLIDESVVPPGGNWWCDLNPNGEASEGICAPGRMKCKPNDPSAVDGWVCQGGTGPVGAEICNGLDDDCDGATDENLTGGGCGVCGDGLEYCMGGSWICCKEGSYNGSDPDTCVAATLPQPEICDGSDNDCDGATDEGIKGDSCGACHDASMYCVNSSMTCCASFDGVTCIAPNTGSQEKCNLIDDDCDGFTDEDLTDGTVCGICKDGGKYCVGGVMQCCASFIGGVCAPTAKPHPEVCDAVDNDCDGATDEFLLKPCSTDTYIDGKGICHKGIETCRLGGWGFGEDEASWAEGECGNEQAPMDEVCDCLDNDCDGLTDELEEEDANSGNGTDWIDYAQENPPAVDDVCGYGNCGHYICDKDRCDYVCDGHGATEVCNGIDDNCNNVVDEGLFQRCGGCDPVLYPPATYPVEDCAAALASGAISSPDEGECQRGVSWCDAPAGSGAAHYGACNGSIGPKNELCDTKDNDCDGTTDEEEDIEQVGEQCQEAEGICEDGWWKCVSDGQGGKGLECCAEVTGSNECVSPQGPVMEECNALDDDCDGLTDEAEDLPIVGEICGSDLGICEAGAIQCLCQGLDPEPEDCSYECVGEVFGTVEICNALDDDCDGLTDEDLPLGATCTNSPTGEPEGICDEGLEVCVNGIWECNANEPTGEICNDLDDDCDGLTDENLAVDCPEGSICIQGECAGLCVAEEMSCPAGEVCEWVEDENGDQIKVCVPNVCEEGSPNALNCVENPYWCDQGHHPPCVCDAVERECVGLCDKVNCPAGKVCIDKNGTCQPIGDDCWTLGCEFGMICAGGACVPDPCIGVVCPEEEYCNNQGQCVEPCMAGDCPAGCYEGGCVNDPCVGIACPIGWTCNSSTGECEKGGPCADVNCLFYEVCENGECIEDPCWNIECPNGLQCIVGACYEYQEPPLSNDADSDTDSDTDEDTDIDTDTDATSIDAGSAGPPAMNDVLATGIGGFMCSSAPLGRRGREPAGAAAALFMLAFIAAVFGAARKKKLVFTVVAFAFIALLTGCRTEPYDFGWTDTDTATGDADADTDGDSDGDSDSDGDTDTCDPEGGDETCDGVDDDCDGETDEDVDLASDPQNCGECGNVCEYQHAIGLCVNGQCEMGDCAAFWWDKNGSEEDGCEYFCQPSSTEDRCDGADLGDGTYVGVDNDCDGETDEDVDFANDPINCGRCKNLCRFDHAVALCVSGECEWSECEEDFWDIDEDPLNGCEYHCAKESDDEICNNIDDDCDGETDEGNPEGGDSCYTADTGCVESGGAFECQGICKAGAMKCVNGNLTCSNEVVPEVMEECNDFDDNCDGATDENLFRVCQTLTGADADKYDTGVCMRGAQTCKSGVWGGIPAGGSSWAAGVCGGEILPSDEQCNGADDDCDGTTDEDAQPPIPPSGSNLDVGECSHVPGTDALGQPMDPHTGACEPGVYVCSGATWSCVGGVKPAGEDCNGQDDDCDGKTDEKVTKPCGGCDPLMFPDAPDDCDPANPNEGLCQQGIWSCVGNDQWGDCIATVPPTEEECDGMDNDCDGLTDEDLVMSCGGGTSDLGPDEGECHTGLMHCVINDDGEAEWSECQGEQGPVSETNSTCDGLDGDCDGVADVNEGLTRICGGCDTLEEAALFGCSPSEPNKGRCEQGVQTCNAVVGESWTACAGEVNPAFEICNLLDDDCDGMTDENLQRNPCGLCGGGMEYCVSGSWVCCVEGTFDWSDPKSCMATKVPGPELCNGLDDDCDGSTDDDGESESWFGLPCDTPEDQGGDQDQCEEGIYVCWDEHKICDEPLGDDLEICNGVDDDCNNQADDSLTDVAPVDTCDSDCPEGEPECRGFLEWMCDYPCIGDGVSGEYVECDSLGQPNAYETLCDGKDNNCDGQTDEGLKSSITSCGTCGNDCVATAGPNVAKVACVQGACGISECAANSYNLNGVFSDGCEYSCTYNGDDSGQCDYVDNDCDGKTDEGAISPEICDGKDNDCDHSTDEAQDLVAPSGLCNTTGLCAGNSAPKCYGTSGWKCKYDCSKVDCVNENTLASVETLCDGKDNNCNGQTDEAFVSESHPPYGTFLKGAPCDNDGTGACYVGGITKCKHPDSSAPGGYKLICCDKTEASAVCAVTKELNMNPAPGLEETGTVDPDGVDDDCDGITDDGVLGCVDYVTVNGSYDIFKYEASRIDATYSSMGQKVTSVPCSELDGQGVIPWTNITFENARTACLRLNSQPGSGCTMNLQQADANPASCWDLCSSAKWYYSCAYGGLTDSSTTPLSYPYSDTYDKARCNGWEYSQQPRIIPTGKAANGALQCVSCWTGGDVWDLSGNAEEWTLGKKGSLRTIRGGSYKALEKGLVCDYDFWSAEEQDFFMGQLGFRCCRNAEPMNACKLAIDHLKDHPFDFEGSKTGKCATDGWIRQGEWEIGKPSGGVSAYQGSCVMATDLDNTYENSQDIYATSPAMNLSACNSGDTVTLSFALVRDIEYFTNCTRDYGIVQVYNGTTWVTVTPAPPYDANSRWCGDIGDPPVSATWTNYSINVSTQARGNSNFRVRFLLHSNSSTVDHGMYIDMVKLQRN